MKNLLCLQKASLTTYLWKRAAKHVGQNPSTIVCGLTLEVKQVEAVLLKTWNRDMTSFGPDGAVFLKCLKTTVCGVHSRNILVCETMASSDVTSAARRWSVGGISIVLQQQTTARFCSDSSIYNEGLHACIIKYLYLESWRQNKDSRTRAGSTGP